jgi:hypothetical protein
VHVLDHYSPYRWRNSTHRCLILWMERLWTAHIVLLNPPDDQHGNGDSKGYMIDG